MLSYKLSEIKNIWKNKYFFGVVIEFVVIFCVKCVGMFCVEFVGMFWVEVMVVLFEYEGGGMVW